MQQSVRSPGDHVQFVKIRLEAAHQRGVGSSLLTTHFEKPESPKMPGGATETNMYKHLARMGQEGWQLISVERIPVAESQTDHVFWPQRST